MTPAVGRVTDSTSEVDALGLAARWTVVPLEIEIDGRRMREGDELSSAEFYTLFQEANAVPLTIPPSPERFADVYTDMLERHEKVLSVHLSGELSRTVGVAIGHELDAVRAGDLDEVSGEVESVEMTVDFENGLVIGGGREYG